MPFGKKWSNANTSLKQASNISKSADLCTFNEGRITDLRVSTIEGRHYSEGAANVKGTTYGSGDFAGLTISAETIRYEGGGKLSDYVDTVNGNDIEQYIQPLVFYNDFEDGKGAARGVVAHALQKDHNDPNLKISAFGMFGAPGENLVLTVADADGGIFKYIEGKATGQLATGKTAITVDASNRVFMGVKGQDLTEDKLNYLVKGSPNAQLYVKGDIVVDGSGVQIEKYLVDDIFVGESAAIMGNKLADPSNNPDQYPFTNDIGVSVPNLAIVLEDTEHQTLSGGYLFVANNSSFFGNVGISGGATLGDGLTLDNSGYWIGGSYSTLNITTPINGLYGSVNQVSYKSIDSNMYDYGYTNGPELISTFQHAIYDGSDSALLLHHSSPNTSRGSLIFLRSKGSIEKPNDGDISDSDVTGEIQFRGCKNGDQYNTGSLTSTGAGNINLSAPNDITIDGSSSVILQTSVTPQSDGNNFVSATPISNSITFAQHETSDNAALAIISADSTTTSDYNSLLDSEVWAIPTVSYIKSQHLWSTAANDVVWSDPSGSISVAGWLQPKNTGVEENVYIPGDLAVNGEIRAGTIYGSITADNMTVTDTFKKTCNEVGLFWGLLDIKYNCKPTETEKVNFTVEATSNFQKSIRARHNPNTSVDGEEKNQFSFPYSMMNGAGLIVNPEYMKNDAIISMIGNRNNSIDSDGENHLYPTQILFGNFYNGNSTADPSGISFLGGIRTSIVEPSGGGIANVDIDVGGTSSLQGTYSVGNIEFCGSNNGQELVPFMTYNGVTADISFNLNTNGVITKSTYTSESDPSNSLVDLSYVKTYVGNRSSKWQVSTDTTTLSPKGSSITVVEAPSFNATSDVAKKENIQTISGALESIDELRGVSYNLKTDETKKTHHGVIAQEIEKIFPDMVAGEEGNKSVAYMEIIGVLVEAVKDLKKRVEELENK